MGVSPLHLFRQGPVIMSLLKTAGSALGSQKSGQKGAGKVLTETVAPRNVDMVNDFLRHVGSDPGLYKGILPPHFFPQWGFPILAASLEGQPYNMSRVLNGGCELEILKPIPIAAPLKLTATLDEVDDDGYRVIFRQRLVTGTDKEPECLITRVNAIIPLKRREGAKKEKARVPEHVREIDCWRLPESVGMQFALATGDFNPVHWNRMYARMSGFRNVILHGFSSMARSFASLEQNVFSGDWKRITAFSARFEKPIVLPAKMGVYIDGEGGIFAGKAPGGPSYMTGNYKSL